MKNRYRKAERLLSEVTTLSLPTISGQLRIAKEKNTPEPKLLLKVSIFTDSTHINTTRPDLHVSFQTLVANKIRGIFGITTCQLQMLRMAIYSDTSILALA